MRKERIYDESKEDGSVFKKNIFLLGLAAFIVYMIIDIYVENPCL